MEGGKRWNLPYSCSNQPYPSRQRPRTVPFSSQVTGADTIEVKMTVANAQIRDALRKFDLRVDEEEKRYVYFFDTPERDLLEAEIIARARRIVGDLAQLNSQISAGRSRCPFQALEKIRGLQD